MKKCIFLLTICCWVTMSNMAQNSIEGIFTDYRDGKEYRWIRIVSQTWLAENLSYEKKGSWCYDNEAKNCIKYGRLYTWEAAKSACPLGWHLPSDKEWNILIEHLGGWKIAGDKLKDFAYWGIYDVDDKKKSGFDARPAGSCYEGFDFKYLKLHSFWWTSTEGRYDGYAIFQYLDDNTPNIHWSIKRKESGLSVRCIKD